MKSKKNLLALILTVALISFGFTDTNIFDAQTNIAHAGTFNQIHDLDCGEMQVDCGQETGTDCEECATITHCYFDYIATLNFTISYIDNKKLLIPEDAVIYSGLKYPPESPPS